MKVSLKCTPLSPPNFTHFSIMASTPPLISFTSVLLLFFLLPSSPAADVDTMALGQVLVAGNTLVSSNGIFELGFFTPGKSLKQYVGVWYRMSKNTVIWVANRELPVVRTPGKLALVEKGVLVISDSENGSIWTSNSSNSGSNSLAAQLLNTGNFVVRDVNNGVGPDEFLWQGFDYPCDTQIPGMKIGYDVRRKRDLYQAAWKSLDDPAESEYTFKLDVTGVPQYFLRKGSQEVFRSGPWNGLRFSGRPNLKPNSVYRFWYKADDDWIYYGYEPIDSSVLLRTVVNVDGALQRFIWNERNQNWNLFLTFATDNCDTYNWCGPYASCNINNSPACKCLKGYVPKSQTDWDTAGWGEGCVRKIAANCSREDRFVKLSSIKVPDTRNALGDMNLSLEQCRMSCLNNCSCTAYGTWNVTDGGKGCLLWFGELKDIRLYTEYGQDIYVRVDSSEIDGISSDRRSRKLIIVASVLSSLVPALIIVLVLHLRKKRKQHIQRQQHLYEHEAGDDNSRRTYPKEINNRDLELPLFDMETVSKATKNFSVANKLGEGGFGPVYKGVLKGGQEIAVKKLSQDSKQGSDEFKNEVMCIAKLQHRNLVKLLGCCIQEEYMLIYEFLPNKSLDLFIFDEKQSTLLDWPKRLNIINGIARGLLYLHQDSRLRIVHRDLKASNILLDSDLNPKISDFGMARICGGNETAASTTRIVGTYGYMSPEYAIDGQFSVKSDVFSFGVLILEIVSGRRNRGFYHHNHHLNLLGHTWKLYNIGQFTDAIHETLKESCILDEVLRALHIGLLCVQQNASDRPNMASVVLMLSSDSSTLPPPKVPGFFTSRNPIEADSSSSKHESCSTNEMSVTLIDPR